jgi:hypothetical protein
MSIKISNVPFNLDGFKKMKKADFMKTYKSLKESNPRFKKLDVEEAYSILKKEADKDK